MKKIDVGIIKNINIMNALQLLGRALMLPIAVLPIAGIMLRLGQEDLLAISAVSSAGSAIFENLPLIFAIGVAIGIADDNHGAAALGGATAFLVLNGTLKAFDSGIDTGVLGGIVCGIIAGVYYNRFKDIALPEWLAFFGGRRFIPIISSVTTLILAYLLEYIWPPIQAGVNYLGILMTETGSIGLFFYGLINRLLIVTGLHHILNNLVWFQFGSFTDAAGKVVHGDLTRFFMGDPTAGSFMAGLFPIMMFGLPAVALAIYRTAEPAQRPLIGGMLFSVAFTSFLTGITEPLEFSFMFLAPALYAAHAVLTGISMVVMGLLGVKLGFTFSAGAFDYVLSYGKSTHGWLLIPVGIIFFAVYYSLFVWAIRRFKLNLAGSNAAAIEEEDESVPADKQGERGAGFVAALGGAENLSSVGACTTRLRLVIKNPDAIDEVKLKQLGAKAVVKLRDGNVQVILGPIADNISESMRRCVGSSGTARAANTTHTTHIAVAAEQEKAAPLAAADFVRPAALSEAVTSEPAQAIDTADTATANVATGTRQDWQKALGGESNILSVSAVATTRIRLEQADATKLDNDALLKLGAAFVQPIGKNIVHLVFNSGESAQRIATLLKA